MCVDHTAAKWSKAVLVLLLGIGMLGSLLAGFQWRQRVREFPTQPSIVTGQFYRTEGTVLESLNGELTVVDGCVRLELDDGRSVIPLFPHGSTVDWLFRRIDAVNGYLYLGDRLTHSDGVILTPDQVNEAEVGWVSTPDTYSACQDGTTSVASFAGLENVAMPTVGALPAR